MKPLFVIMVTYRRFTEFKRTCDSLIPTLPQGSKLAIVVNGDFDEEYRSYLNHLTLSTAPSAVNIEILSTGNNKGWGASMNEGLKLYSDWREYEYVLESNNDVEYEPDWFEKSKAIMEKHQDIGILGLWAHPYHGVRVDRGDILIKDDMPATAWFFRTVDLAQFLPFPEHGPCRTSGGNGEDVKFRDRVQNELKRSIAAPKNDLAHHIDGYNIPNLGKDNPAYL